MKNHNKEVDKEIETLAEEHANSFSQLSDIEGAIIRGHILVERAVNRAIELSIPEKDEFKSDRFTFSQKATISHMLGASVSFKTEINALNKLRNQIAHTLVYDEKLIELIINSIHKKAPEIIDLNNSKLTNLTTSISFICGAISVSHATVNQKLFLTALEQNLNSKQKHGS